MARRSIPSAMCLLICTSLLAACGLIREKPENQISEDPSMALAEASIKKPLSPEETEALFSDVAHNWFYGQGIGESAVALGGVLIFPPYALYLAGNAILSLSGYQEVRVTEALPESGQDVWNSFYDGVTSVPGKVTSELSGEPYVTKRQAEKTINKYIHNQLDVPPAPVLYAGTSEGNELAWR